MGTNAFCLLSKPLTVVSSKFAVDNVKLLLF